MSLGENGTEQFVLTTRVNGKVIGTKPIHDPFHTTRIKMRGFRHAWNALTKGIEVHVSLDGSAGAQRAIMMLDPKVLDQETSNILNERAGQRDRTDGTVGFYVADSHA